MRYDDKIIIIIVIVIVIVIIGFNIIAFVAGHNIHDAVARFPQAPSAYFECD